MPGLEKLKEEPVSAFDLNYGQEAPSPFLANDHENGLENLKNGHIKSPLTPKSGGSANGRRSMNGTGSGGGGGKHRFSTTSSNSSNDSSGNQRNGDATVTSPGSGKTSTLAGLVGRKKTGAKRNKDDPFRFAGDGVDFKCKLIGFQEVEQARGDQMCQDAIQACKAVVKRKGEHKQRIIFNISLEGLKIRDAASNESLHTFPVSKVSFIAKDVSDSRAFGFVYSISEHEHHFYGVKTEKMSDAVVFSIRDMFQIVYEMKKKQMEQAKAAQMHKLQNGQEVIKCETGDDDGGLEMRNISNVSNGGVPEANLLDLESELENLEQGMQNMDKWGEYPMNNGSETNSSSVNNVSWATTSLSSSALTELNTDPFVDQIFTSSMNSFNSSISASVSNGHHKEPLVPPPPSSHSRRTHIVARSTLFGPSSPNDVVMTSAPPTTETRDFFDSAPRVLAPAGQCTPPTVAASPSCDPFDVSHVTGTLIAGSATRDFASTPLAATNNWTPTGLTSARLPSAIPPTTVAPQATTSIFGQPSFMDDYSPDRSVFLSINGTTNANASAQANGVMNGTHSTSMFNNAINDSSTLRSLMGVPDESPLAGCLVDWSAPQNSVPLAPIDQSSATSSLVTSSRYNYAPPLPPRPDPFAHLKPQKKSINQLRQEAVGGSLGGAAVGDDDWLGGVVKSNGVAVNGSDWTQKDHLPRDWSARPPEVPPRDNNKTVIPMLPRPPGSSSTNHRDRHLVTSPLKCGQSAISNTKNDPFADEFFA